MKTGECKLCRQNKMLCEKSHIISKHAYQLLQDSNNLTLYVDKNTIDKPGKQKRYTGEFEGGILCEDCESKLSGYETYAANIIFDNQIQNIQKRKLQTQSGAWLVQINGDGYNYKKFKLYLLSILWKSSICARQFFKEVSLNDDTEIIREMFLNDNPGEIYEYPCFIILPALIHQGIGFDLQDIGLMRSPLLYEKDGVKFVDFLISGCRYQFAITKKEGATRFISVQRDCLLLPLFTQEQTLNHRKQIVDTIKNWQK